MSLVIATPQGRARRCPEIARHTAGQARGGDPGAYGFRPFVGKQPDFLE